MLSSPKPPTPLTTPSSHTMPLLLPSKPHHLSFPPRTTSHSSLSSTPFSPPSPDTTTLKKRKRYRRSVPGEDKGITEEMRFVAMKLRTPTNSYEQGTDKWKPSLEGFLKYLVDSKLVFDTVESIVQDSTDVSYTCFRNTGLERAASLSKDLEWFREQGIAIPEPSSPGVTYSAYLKETAEQSTPSFLCHLYNIYFAHMTGSRGIGQQVCEELLEGRELEFYKWEGDVEELLRNVRENLNKLGEDWRRSEKKKCLHEAAKSFQFLAQIVRLIIMLQGTS